MVGQVNEGPVKNPRMASGNLVCDINCARLLPQGLVPFPLSQQGVIGFFGG